MSLDREQVEIGIFAYLPPEQRRESLMMTLKSSTPYLPSINRFKAAFTDTLDGNPVPWQKFCKETENSGIYDFFHLQYINTLANYLEERAHELGATPQTPIKLVGIRTGTNHLYHFLSQKLDNLIEYSVTNSPAEFLIMDQPDIILCQWMTEGKDWTAGFRQLQHVREYILIGATTCGEKWQTWGIEPFSDAYHDEKTPYAKDGFELVDLKSSRKSKQECWEKPCYLDKSPDEPTHSLTISFRRKPKPQMIQLPLL